MLGLSKLRWLALGLALAPCLGGCQTTGHSTGRTAALRPSSPNRSRPIIYVFTLFYQRPWLNLDAAGDRDPEGIEYRVFLDPGTGKGVPRDGTFLIAMYHIDRSASGKVERKLVSDWKYPTSDFGEIDSPLLGRGYLVRLRWATKDIAGKEVEIVTRFENTDGSVISAGTKRLRVPKYTS